MLRSLHGRALPSALLGTCRYLTTSGNNSNNHNSVGVSSPIVPPSLGSPGAGVAGAPAVHPNALLRAHNSKMQLVSEIRRSVSRNSSSSAREAVEAAAAAHGPGCACCAPRRQMHSGSTRALRAPHSSGGGSSSSSNNNKGNAMGSGEDVAEELTSFVGARMIQSVQRQQPPRGSGIQPLLDYNKHWACEIARLNPEYFIDLAKQQTPQYLWIGCSDSRVPANEIVGLYPGDVFVHRNIANIVCNSDLNVLAVLQYAIDCLKVEHVIVSGHYKCGGVTAALHADRIGLADHWILHVGAVKKRHWRRMLLEIPARAHLDALCELNVLAQVEHVVDTHLIQRVWNRQNAEDALARKEGRKSRNRPEDEVEIHGWVYGLEDGIVRPLLSLNRQANAELALAEAVEALFLRYSQS